MTTQLKVIAKDGLRVRLAPDGEKIGVLPYESIIEADTMNEHWAAFGLYVNGVRIGTGYASMLYLVDPNAQDEYPTPVFTANKTEITAGETATLSWSDTDGAEALHVNSEPKTGPDGTMDVKPTADTTYTLLVDYPDADSVSIDVKIKVTQPQATNWSLQYFNNETLTGDPVLETHADEINFDWKDGSPGVGVRADLFSARAMRIFVASEAGTYAITVTSDDGARVFVDSALAMDHWTEQSKTDYTCYVDLGVGVHTIVVEYFEHGGQAVFQIVEPHRAERPVDVDDATIKIGVNVSTHERAAEDAYQRNCDFFVIMNGEVTARKIKAASPKAFVVQRLYTDTWTLSGSAYADRVPGRADGIVNEFINEADAWPYGTVKQLHDRIDQELKAADILTARGVAVGLGVFSMGCVDFTNDDICKEVARYAPYYNNNPLVYFAMHPYSPTKDHIWSDESLIWYERRWEYLFTKCRFNAAKKGLYFSEMGVDGAGGGFPHWNFTDEEFRAWLRRWRAVQARPVVVDGVSYESPVIGGAIFIYGQGQDDRWRTFDITNQIGVVQEVCWP